MRRLLPVLGLLAACSDSGPSTPKRAACTAARPAPSDPGMLGCPFPDRLPFQLASSGFHQAANEAIEAEEGCSKDEASDTLGNPGGVTASIYLDDAARPSAAPVSYHGTKARSKPTSGLLADP